VVHHRLSVKFDRDLIQALESARTRLAVAIASETKSTPPEQRQYYLETADRMQRFTKMVRAGSGALQNRHDWERTLEALKRLPAQSKALPLCQTLREIVPD
jgi:hypothetical protein